MVALKASMQKLGLFTVAVLAVACSSESPDSSGSQNTNPPPTDNPMATPCAPLNSGYAGDERCIIPPDPALGLQLHVGPTDYTDAAQLAEFELPVGKEVTQCYYMRAPNTETFNFYEQHYRMRQGSHHLIMHMNTSGADHALGWGTCEAEGFIPIGGTQTGVAEFPTDGKIAPEDADLYRPLVPNALLKMELHFVNASAKPILREVWVNFVKKEVHEGDRILGGVFVIGAQGMNIPPHTERTLTYTTAPLTEPKRVVSLYGHRHAHTTRFSIWAVRAGARELIYEDYDWKEPTELSYNSVIQNPAPDPVGLKAGGTSGILNFEVGDTMEWECEINNDSDGTLTFRNEVFTGEMCNVFGSSVAEGLFWGGRGTLMNPQ